ncbi:MAG: hypothetical protein ABI574_05395 [Burkholderiales bacterium]
MRRDATMAERVIAIHPAAPAKPAWGAPCNGCGVCCLVAPCPVGVLVSRRRQGACSAVRWDEAQTRYICSLAGHALLGRLVRRFIAAGEGCDCDIEVE